MAIARSNEKRAHILRRFPNLLIRPSYITVVSNPVTCTVLHVSEDRTTKSLGAYYATCSSTQLESLKSMSMDIWGPYIQGTRIWVPGAAQKIAFDRFHVAKYIGNGVDEVRKIENRELRKQGMDTLTGTKYVWLTNRKHMSAWHKKQLQQLKKSTLKTSWAWAIKEFSQTLWHYKSRTWALKGWKIRFASRRRSTVSHLGAQGLEAMVILGHAMPACSHEKSGQDH